MIYVYGLVPAGEVDVSQEVAAQPGIDGKHATTWLQHQDILARICEVEEAEFSQEKVDQLAQDPLWVQEKGRHHHECIAELQRECTVIPMSFCTLFASEASLRRTLDEQGSAIRRLFSELAGHHEWSVRIYSHREELKQQLTAGHPSILALLQELEQMPPGKRFIMKKKVEQQIDNIVTAEIESRWTELQERLSHVTVRHLTKANWSRQMTGREEDMVYNATYLVADEGIDAFFAVVEAGKGEAAENGWSIECTGPWPPYHFAKLNRED